MVDFQKLESLVNDQRVVGLGLVDLFGKPHTTPVWINYYDGSLYIFTRKERRKSLIAAAKPDCMVAFVNGAVRGKIKLVERGTPDYDKIIDVPDKRYQHQAGYEEYKKNWDIALRIIPSKIYD